MTNKKRGEVIFSGIGGGGVLLAGEILAQAANTAFEHVVWFPNYSGAVRGGPSECSVIFSDEEIASPVLSRLQAVVLLDPSQLKAYEDRVRPGGMLIVESAGLQQDAARDDITTIKVPALESARAMGNHRGANFILLGVYIKSAKLIPPELIEKALAAKRGDNTKARWLNLAAFRHGLR